MVLPGPEAQQLATYIGWLMHRTWGGIVAGALVRAAVAVHPDRAVVDLHGATATCRWSPAVLYGIKPAVTAIVVHAAWRIGSRALKNGVLWAIAAAAFVAIFAFDVPFPAIVLVAGVHRHLGGRLAPGKFAAGGGHGAVTGSVRARR